MRRAWVVLCAVVLIAGLGAGCATSSAIESARMSLDKAKAAGAQNKAAYEYSAAEAYLNKASVEAAEGDCKGAKAFTEQSKKYSAEALQAAGGGAK